MNRREALRALAAGPACGALAGGLVLVAAPSEAVAADPLLDLIREYRTQLAIYNASGRLTDEEDDALAEATMNPPWNRLRDDCPMPTTMEGALEAIRLAKKKLEGGYGGIEQSLLIAALAFFDGRA